MAVNPLGLAPGGVVFRGGVLLVLFGQGGHLVCVLQAADQGVDLAFHLLLQLFVLVTVLGVHSVLGCQLRQECVALSPILGQGHLAGGNALLVPLNGGLLGF